MNNLKNKLHTKNINNVDKQSRKHIRNKPWNIVDNRIWWKVHDKIFSDITWKTFKDEMKLNEES